LQSQADSEKRNARANAFDQRIANLEIVERAHHLAEVADAGENQFLGAPNAGSVANQLILSSDSAEGVLDGTQVARAIVKN